MLTVERFLSPEDGLIASVKPGFAPREGQDVLSQTILDAYQAKKPVIVEAPTGFGKSFAVLVPSIIKVIQNGGRVVISTETLALQDQYYYKDLPLLQEACKAQGINFTYAVAKGRGNYICKAKLNEEAATDEYCALVQWAKKQRVFYEEANTFKADSGDIGSVPFEFDVRDWITRVGADEDCEKKACPYYGEGRKGSDCFVYEAVHKFMNSQIVVTNHTLLLLDAQVGSGVLLGGFDLLIVDEAHSLPEKAQDAWGISLKPRTVSKTVRLAGKMLDKVGCHYPMNIEGYREMETEVFKPFAPVLGKNINMKQVKPEIIEASKAAAWALIDRLKLDYKGMNELIVRDEEDPQTQTINGAKDKLAKIIHDLGAVYGDKVNEEYAENWLSFMETGYNNKREPHAVLNLKPIDVGPLMKGLIHDMVPCTVMMSATMKINGSFSFMKRELGMPDTTIDFTGVSPFSFDTQVIGYFPTHLPDPDDEENYLDSIVNEIVQLIEYNDGKTMVLFTNAAQMRLAWEWVGRRVKYPCYVQGQMQKQALIDVFSQDVHSCLFATRSFFTGVDIPGETLSCVILVKAPFRVPTEPMFKAKCDMLDKNGINSFSNYSMPLMLFDVRQSFGRLIRTTTDKGMFVLLDSRALKKSYGGTIRKTLPRIGEIADIGRPVISAPKKRVSIASLEED